MAAGEAHPGKGRPENLPPDDEIFTIPARKCRRCGGLLTSGQALRDGYGACCLRKLREEAAKREKVKGQIGLFG